MDIVLWTVIFIGTFSIMEFNAWWMHRYVMHGFLWNLHEDHHHKKHDSWFEKNDWFFVFYAVIITYERRDLSLWYRLFCGA